MVVTLSLLDHGKLAHHHHYTAHSSISSVPRLGTDVSKECWMGWEGWVLFLFCFVVDVVAS
jgi:hypothetical protein